MWNRIKAFWASHKARYTEALQRYGVAVWLTAVLLRVLMAAFVVFVYQAGYGFQGLEIADAGVIGAAYLLVWPLAPIRWILAALIGPAVVRWIRKMRGLDPALPPVEPANDDGPAESAP